MSGRAKGFATWNPHAPTRELLADILAALDEYAGYLPLTVRQVFYRLAGKGYPKTESFYDKVSNVLNRARRAGRVPFDSIRDDGVSRRGGERFGYDTPREYLVSHDEIGNYYRRSWHEDQPLFAAVLCEASGMVPILSRVTDAYRVPVASSSGFDSLTVKHDLWSDARDRFEERGQPTVLLHLGDFDPSGDSIFSSMVEDLSAFCRDSEETPDDLIEMRRVALTREQVVFHDLPTAPPKDTDSRTGNWRDEDMTCQLEAVPPELLMEFCRQAVETALDMDVLRESRERERREYLEVQETLDRVNVVLRDAFETDGGAP